MSEDDFEYDYDEDYQQEDKNDDEIEIENNFYEAESNNYDIIQQI